MKSNLKPSKTLRAANASSPQDLIARYDAAIQTDNSAEIAAGRSEALKMFARVIRKALVLKKQEADDRDIARYAFDRLTNALDFPHTSDGQQLRRGTFRTVTNRTLDTKRDIDNRPLTEEFDPRIHTTSQFAGPSNVFAYLTDAELRIDLQRFAATLSPREQEELAKAVSGVPAGDRQATRMRKRIREKAEKFGISRSFQTSLSIKEETDVELEPLTRFTRFDIALIAFEIACPDASDADVARWSRLYPDMAYFFAAHAAVKRGDLEFFELSPEDEAEVDWLVSRGMANFLESQK